MGVTELAATARLASDLLDVARLLDVAARPARRGLTAQALTAFGEPITLVLTAFGEPITLPLTAFGEPITRELVEQGELDIVVCDVGGAERVDPPSARARPLG